MKRLFNKFVYAGLFLISITPAFATETSSSWQLHVAPYLWAINMDGTTQVGQDRAHINQNFGDILSHLDVAGMVWLEADKENVGIFLNVLYSVLTDTAKIGNVSVDAKSRFGLLSGGASYRFPVSAKFALSPYAGFRYTSLHNSLNASTPTASVSASDNQHWIDPIIGLRALYQFNKAWSLLVAGDVGGTNLSTDNSYNIQGLIGYQPQTMMKNSTVYIGYRQLKQLYETGSGANQFVWNMRISGPVVGVDFGF